MPEQDNEQQKDEPEFDPFKDTALRYLGYANEVGEAFRHVISHYQVMMTYGVASGYVVCDALDKGYKTWQNTSQENSSVGTRSKQVCVAIGDTLVWQGLASVAIPGFVINRICWMSGHLLQRSPLPDKLRKMGIIAAGLGSIPFIIKPIDASVEYGMDNTFRKLYNHPLK